MPHCELKWEIPIIYSAVVEIGNPDCKASYSPEFPNKGGNLTIKKDQEEKTFRAMAAALD